MTVQELDGSFNHTLQIEENSLKHDIPCHSKSRRWAPSPNCVRMEPRAPAEILPMGAFRQRTPCLEAVFLLPCLGASQRSSPPVPGEGLLCGSGLGSGSRPRRESYMMPAFPGHPAPGSPALLWQ